MGNAIMFYSVFTWIEIIKSLKMRNPSKGNPVHVKLLFNFFDSLRADVRFTLNL